MSSLGSLTHKNSLTFSFLRRSMRSKRRQGTRGTSNNVSEYRETQCPNRNPNSHETQTAKQTPKSKLTQNDPPMRSQRPCDPNASQNDPRSHDPWSHRTDPAIPLRSPILRSAIPKRSSDPHARSRSVSLRSQNDPPILTRDPDP